MKKTIKSLLAIAVTAFAFAACSDVPEPYNIPSESGGGGGGEAETIGTLENPLTVEQAIAEFDKLADNAKSTKEAIVRGKVSRNITSASSFNQYHNINYYISDDGTQNKEVEVYKGMDINNEVFPSVDAIKAGDDVIVQGYLYKYKNKNTGAITLEIDGGYLLKHITNGGGGGDTPTPSGNDGSEAKPFTIAEAIAAGSGTEKYVKGYIVGWVEGQVLSEGAHFDANATVKTNVLIADSKDETDVSKCMPVQLPTGDIRNAVNLQDNSGNYKQEVLLNGNIEKYFGATGIKTTKYAKIGDKEAGTKPGGESGGGESGGGATGKTGTLAAPLTVAEIYAEVAALPADQESSGDYYAKGKVCSVKYTFSAQYGTATFNISDDGSTTGKQFTCYGTYYLGNKPWVDGNTQIKVGDEVVVCGKVINYGGNTPEFNNKKNYLISLNGVTE